MADKLPKDPNQTVIEFKDGFLKGEVTITKVTLTKPKTRALRGLSLSNLLQMDIDTIAKLASRITNPSMTEHDVYELSPSDLTKLGTGIISFFVETDESPNG